MTFPWLTVLGLLPLLGSVIVFALRGRGGKVAAMVFSLVTLVVGVATFFMTGLTEKVSWISPIGAWYALDLDGMSKVLVLLTVILVPIVLIAEWHVGDSSTQNQNAADTTSQVAPARWSSETFMALALMLEGFTLYVFMASDLLLFYIFFEATLIPMYFLIAGWGGARRAAAAMKFLLFSLFGGFVLLLGVIGMYAVSAGAGKPSLLTADLAGLSMGQGMERWLFVAFFIAFAIKAPMVPVHTWLPDAAEQARPGASTLLVATLDKIGTFGMIRFCLAFFPEATKWASPFVLVLAVISIFYGAFMAIGSKNLLRLVA
ncbi:MAG: NADH-quinone oxidoreductase subunit M, partial [Propionibacterium sp.]|nr:NADH-quinone oxidoreductase subunit M [Propionibacterium sp.]